MKHTTPRGIALYLSVLVTILVMAGCITVFYIIENEFFILPAFIIGIIVFTATFFLAYYSVEKFIYSKVKLIYKNISSQKITRIKKNEINKSPDMLAEVNEQVLSWAQDKKDEIMRLKAQENFRREFIGNLSHELKTPVFSIQGYILTLLEGGLEDPKINRDFLERAARAVDRITHMIEDLDIITQLESGQLQLNLKKVNIIEIAKEVIESLDMQAAEKNIKLGFNRNYDKPIYVKCDSGRIAQVFTNLLVNSINYGNDNGKTDIRFFDMEDNILIEVADNGLGIAQEHLPRLFERFYRVDKSRSRHQGGTGLGLAIVKHIIEAHDHSISVRSTEGVGTTFAFTLSKAK
jgi:two-component system phosphate regulon sensor histidine kinase PhoR